MSQSTMAETTPTLPAEVIAYAAEHGVERCLRPLLEMTQRLFPLARRLQVFLEDDPEIAELKFIVFQVAVVDKDAFQAYQAREQWIRESLECCPPPCTFPFVLGLEVVE